MKNSIRIIAGAISILLILSSKGFAQDTYNLQYKLAKGNAYVYNTNGDMKMTQEVMGKETKVNNDIHGIIRFTVDNVADNGDMQITSAMDSLSLKTRIMDKDSSMNLNALIGKRVQALVSKNGNVKNCTMIDTVDEMSLRTVNLAQEVKRFFSAFAGKDVKVGESWSTTSSDTQHSYGGEIVSKVEITCTLSGKENKNGHDCVKIPFTAKVKITGKLSIQGMDFNMEGEGSSTGAYYFDPKAGVLIYSEGNMNNDMTIASTGQQNMVIPITQNLTYTNTLISN